MQAEVGWRIDGGIFQDLCALEAVQGELQGIGVGFALGAVVVGQQVDGIAAEHQPQGVQDIVPGILSQGAVAGLELPIPQQGIVDGLEDAWLQGGGGQELLAGQDGHLVGPACQPGIGGFSRGVQGLARKLDVWLEFKGKFLGQQLEQMGLDDEESQGNRRRHGRSGEEEIVGPGPEAGPLSITPQQPFPGLVTFFLDPFKVALHGAQIHLIVFVYRGEAIADDLGGEPLLVPGDEAQHGHESKHDRDQMRGIMLIRFSLSNGAHGLFLIVSVACMTMLDMPLC